MNIRGIKPLKNFWVEVKNFIELEYEMRFRVSPKRLVCVHVLSP